MINENVKELDWEKVASLVPVVVQDIATLQVLMVGYMNPEALDKTIETKKVTFYSRTKKRLWTKGETSGNTLELVALRKDCDSDALVALARPKGPTCHKNTTSCFGASTAEGVGFLGFLDALIEKRIRERPEGSYTTRLMERGLDRIAQKVGEEAVETVISAKNDDDEDFLAESSDLLFHLLVLLRAKGKSLDDVLNVLRERNGLSASTLTPSALASSVTAEPSTVSP